jgi:hypothetical protein
MAALSSIGMSVPGSMTDAQSSLAQQVQGETDEERKKRLAQLRAAQGLPAGVSSLAQGYGSALGMSA